MVLKISSVLILISFNIHYLKSKRLNAVLSAAFDGM